MPADTVLLTRPDPDNRRVAGRLAADGIATATWPLTRIVPVPGLVPVPPGTGGLIFTSRNAVVAFAANSPDRGLRAWCVGARTAQAAREAGFSDVASAGGDVASLARLLADAAPSQLLYLRGRHVSADLPELLAGTGHRTESRVVYSAEPAGPPPADVEALLRSGGVGTVALWSRRAAAILADHLKRNPDWPVAAMQAVVISGRAARPLTDCGLRRVTTSANPDEEGMLDAIRAAVRQ